MERMKKRVVLFIIGFFILLIFIMFNLNEKEQKIKEICFDERCFEINIVKTSIEREREG